MNLSEFVAEGTAPILIAEAVWFEHHEAPPILPSSESLILWEEQVVEAGELNFRKQRTLWETAREAGSMLAWGAAALCLSKKNKITHIVATAALEYLTDFYAVPERFAAGFEQELGHRARLSIYGVLATTLRMT